MKIGQLLLDLFGFDPPAPGPKPAPRPKPAAAPPRVPEPRRTGERSGPEVLAIARRSGGAWERVVFTSNRRIMASVANRGRDLRLNEAFAAAPDSVLVAVGELFTARNARRRNAAKEAVRRFIAQIPPTPNSAPRPRTRRATAADRAQIARMQAEFDRVNAERFGGSLPRVPIHLSGRMKRRNGHFSATPLEIVMSRRLCLHGAAGEAEHTMRHEMIHLWQFVEGLPVDHGPAFRKMARRLDVHPRATRSVEWMNQDR
ncbi:MAG TPA: SprT-like domain-containing protein [Longimicrobium sp.]